MFTGQTGFTDAQHFHGQVITCHDVAALNVHISDGIQHMCNLLLFRISNNALITVCGSNAPSYRAVFLIGNRPAALIVAYAVPARYAECVIEQTREVCHAGTYRYLSRMSFSLIKSIRLPLAPNSPSLADSPA